MPRQATMTETALVSIQVGQPWQRGTVGAADPMQRPWTSAIFKDPVSGPVRVDQEGIAGDRQADLRHHGGTDKAVLAYCADHYPLWRDELESPEMTYGAFGENLSLAGWSEADVCIGDVVAIGDARFEVSQPRQPCYKLGRKFQRADMPKLVQKTGRAGWYLRVLTQGVIEAGQQALLQARPHPSWTVRRAQQVMNEARQFFEDAAQLSTLPQLAEDWQRALRQRLATRA